MGGWGRTQLKPDETTEPKSIATPSTLPWCKNSSRGYDMCLMSLWLYLQTMVDCLGLNYKRTEWVSGLGPFPLSAVDIEQQLWIFQGPCLLRRDPLLSVKQVPQQFSKKPWCKESWEVQDTQAWMGICMHAFMPIQTHSNPPSPPP